MKTINQNNYNGQVFEARGINLKTKKILSDKTINKLLSEANECRKSIPTWTNFTDGKACFWKADGERNYFVYLNEAGDGIIVKKPKTHWKEDKRIVNKNNLYEITRGGAESDEILEKIINQLEKNHEEILKYYKKVKRSYKRINAKFILSILLG